MRRLLTLVTSCLVLAIASNVTAKAAQAQVTPDRSLPNNSLVNDELEVTGGTVAGDNLFHSFTEFSVNSGETVSFNNDSEIANIISRVTGNNISTIDGLLRANGSADLFLINPNGIILGNNAALDIGGSFIGSTANSIQLSNGSEFSAVNPEALPLLTVSIPVGLQFGNNAGDIVVQGLGNNLSIDDNFAIDRSNRPVGLEVDRGNTLALLGGNVFLPGGNLTSVEGRVILGSVSGNETVGLNSDNLGWNFDYSTVSSFNNISLSQAASIEVSGSSGGEVRLQGRDINLDDGSAILADTLGDGAGRTLELSATSLSIADGSQINSVTFGAGNGGNIQVTAGEIEVLGKSDDGEFISGLFVQSDEGETGDGGNLTIETDRLVVKEGADISTTAFGTGNAGNLNITANTIELLGISDAFPSGSGLSTTTEGAGNGGNLSIETNELLVRGGADISTTTFGFGNAGDLNIKASTVQLTGGADGVGSSGLFANVDAESLGSGGNLNLNTNSLTIANGAQIAALTNSITNAGTINIQSQSIDLVGSSANGLPSGIFATTEVNGGTGGNIAIATENLNITDVAQIATTTLGSGNGGNIEIVANDSVRIEGNSDVASSGIFATALLSDGAGGDVTIETNSLSLLNGATISVSNFPSNNNSPLNPGNGAAGNINIIAPEIFLDERAAISADTFSGDRGNINFQTDSLILRRQSNISTNAQETATGGNISIDAEDGFIVAFPEENSDITANAVFGDGGRVNIIALDIFGFQPRLDLTPFSDITASSEFGIAGNIDLNNQNLNPIESLTELDRTFNPPQLVDGCNIAASSNSSFVNLGRGGLNSQPHDALGVEDILGDVRVPQQWSNNSPDKSIVEAKSWVVGDRGNIVLVADNPTKFAPRCN